MCNISGHVSPEELPILPATDNNAGSVLIIVIVVLIMNHFKKNKGPNTVGQRPNEELWTRTGTFVNKPQKGWLHTEERVKQGGVCYGVTVGSFVLSRLIECLWFLEWKGKFDIKTL